WGSDVLISSKRSFFHRTRTKYVLSKADLVTCDGMNIYKELSALGVEKDKIVLAPMGVELNLLRERSISGRFENKEEIIILSMRSLEPVYDLKTLIKAIPLVVNQSHKNIKFWIIGEGRQKEELVKLSLNLGIERNIEFRGYIAREELEDCLQKADIYISTSLSDSTSVSLLEAMASGLLPVVSDIPGNLEWIEEGKNGFLFPAGNYQALAQKIVWMINDFKDIEKLRMENQKIIKEKALWEENMKMIENKFLELFRR
ncbi:MAG: glycosyltransferase family 4 protein, partial [candidate division Zixibacteria bacterium]|nr:glycosyltransferase family 4 protein [candidate division Zixibacteria bacterium]